MNSRLSGLDRHRFLELVRFGLVGSMSAGLYFGAYALLVLVGVPYIVAALIGFAIAATNGYLLHHHWTFKTGEPTTQGFAGWIALQGSALAVNTLALWFVVSQLGAPQILAQLVLLPLIPLTTFVLSRRYIFGAHLGKENVSEPSAGPEAR